MNPYLYPMHDAMQMMMQLTAASAHMTAQQIKFATALTRMNPVMDACYKMAEATIEQQPSVLTYHNFNILAEQIPELGDYADRLPSKVSIHFGASSNDNTALSNKDLDHLHIHASYTKPGENLESFAEVLDMVSKDYPKPDWEITEATINGKTKPVAIKTELERDFVDLLHFDTGLEDAPKVLLPAPMSGHYSTLIRSKVQSYLNAGFDVYVVDINNPKHIPKSKGTMNLEGLADRYVDFLQHLGPVHIDATCQAATPTIIASEWLSKNDPDNAPLSLTLVAAPVDPHISPAEVSEYGKKSNIKDIKKKAYSVVPYGNAGAGREVAAGFAQGTGFITMNPALHAHSLATIYNHLVVGLDKKVESNREFYEEYLAFTDMEAAYHSQTVEDHFRLNKIAKGEFEFRGETLDMANLAGIPILTMEGEKDDISAPGQTIAAHDIIQPEIGYHYRIPGVGHYGAFHGSKCREHAMPRAFTFMHEIEKLQGRDHGAVLGADGNPLSGAIALESYAPEMKKAAIELAHSAWNKKISKARNIDVYPKVTMEFPGLAA